MPHFASAEAECYEGHTPNTINKERSDLEQGLPHEAPSQRLGRSVEVGGFEPPSEKLKPKLSTRLVSI